MAFAPAESVMIEIYHPTTAALAGLLGEVDDVWPIQLGGLDSRARGGPKAPPWVVEVVAHASADSSQRRDVGQDLEQQSGRGHE